MSSRQIIMERSFRFPLSGPARLHNLLNHRLCHKAIERVPYLSPDEMAQMAIFSTDVQECFQFKAKVGTLLEAHRYFRLPMESQQFKDKEVLKNLFDMQWERVKRMESTTTIRDILSSVRLGALNPVLDSKMCDRGGRFWLRVAFRPSYYLCHEIARAYHNVPRTALAFAPFLNYRVEQEETCDANERAYTIVEGPTDWGFIVSSCFHSSEKEVGESDEGNEDISSKGPSAEKEPRRRTLPKPAAQSGAIPVLPIIERGVLPSMSDTTDWSEVSNSSQYASTSILDADQDEENTSLLWNQGWGRFPRYIGHFLDLPLDSVPRQRLGFILSLPGLLELDLKTKCAIKLMRYEHEDIDYSHSGNRWSKEDNILFREMVELQYRIHFSLYGIRGSFLDDNIALIASVQENLLTKLRRPGWLLSLITGNEFSMIELCRELLFGTRIPAIRNL